MYMEHRNHLNCRLQFSSSATDIGKNPSNYSIISGVIYARGDYWTTGQWSRRIKLSQLDLPATIKANQQQGIMFRVPAAPNEVITRP